MQHWFLWWIARSGGGMWYGPTLLFDEQLYQFENDVEQGTPGVIHLYRWVWDGQMWQYDTRKAVSLYVRAGEQRLAAGWP